MTTTMSANRWTPRWAPRWALRVVLGCVAAGLLSAAARAGSDEFRVRRILPKEQNWSGAGWGRLNDRGQVASTRFLESSPIQPSFVTGADGLGLTDLADYPGQFISQPTGINRAGVSVGISRSHDGDIYQLVERCVRWDTAGALTLVKVRGAVMTRCSGINDQGVIVGVGYPEGSTQLNGFYDRRFLGAGVEPAAVNNAGQVVGRYRGEAFMTDADGRHLRKMGTLDGSSSRAVDVNNLGQVLGQVGDKHSRVFITDANGANMRYLNEAPLTDGYRSEAVAINDQGWVVGYFGDGTSGVVPFLARPPGYQAEEINQLVVMAEGERIDYVSDVNNDGQIIGRSSLGNLILLTPRRPASSGRSR